MQAGCFASGFLMSRMAAEAPDSRCLATAEPIEPDAIERAQIVAAFACNDGKALPHREDRDTLGQSGGLDVAGRKDHGSRVLTCCSKYGSAIFKGSSAGKAGPGSLCGRSRKRRAAAPVAAETPANTPRLVQLPTTFASG